MKRKHHYSPKNVAHLSLLLSLGLLLSLNLHAQTYQQITDSLINVLDSTSDPQKRVDLLNDISYNNRRTTPEAVLKYAQRAHRLAKNLDYKKGLAIANKNMGIAHYKMASPQDTTIKYYQKAIDAATAIDDFYTQAACKNNIALVYLNTASYNNAISYFLDGISIFDQHFQEEMRLKALMLANVAISFFRVDNVEKAILYMEKAIKMAERNQYKSILSMYLDDLGRMYLAVNRLEEASTAFARVSPLQEKLGDYYSQVQTFHNRIDLYLKKEDWKQAEELGLQALNISEKHEFPMMVCASITRLSNIYNKLGNYDKAIEFGQKAIAVSRKANSRNYEKDALQYLATAYAGKQQHNKAYSMLQQHLNLTDSIRNTEKEKYIAELEAQYQNKVKEKEIALLNVEKTAQKGQMKLLWILFAVSLGFIGLLAYFFIKRNQQADIIDKKNAELEKYIEYNLQLENFAYIASHDLKTPLRTIISFTQLLGRKLKNKLEPNETEYLQFIIDGTKEMSFLIEDLLNYSRIQRRDLQLERIEVEPFVEQILRHIGSFIEEKSAQIHLQLDTPIITADRTKMQQLLQNLITNAIKFHKKEQLPKVEISCIEKDMEWYFKIRDNGIGIESEYFDRIFLIFKRLNNKSEYEGSGIGLAICKKIIEQHGGTIWVESRVGEGSSFCFNLPKKLELISKEVKEQTEVVIAA